jgi:mono/diheme cytochrome c family protein
MWLIALTLILFFLGGVYFDHHSGWFNARVYSPYVSAEQLELYQPKSGAAAAAAQGKKVYETICGICHGVDGMGKPNQAPPLAGSEWVIAGGFHRLAQIPLIGLNGSLQVEGKDWNLNMAPMGAALSDADLAAVLTYIRTSWGNKAGTVSADDVKAIRAVVAGHPAIAGVQLKDLPE